MSSPCPVRAPRETQLTCKSWLTEVPFRRIQNNPDKVATEGTPRRLVAIVEDLAERQQDHTIVVKRPPASRAYTAEDTPPTPPRALLRPKV